MKTLSLSKNYLRRKTVSPIMYNITKITTSVNDNGLYRLKKNDDVNLLSYLKHQNVSY